MRLLGFAVGVAVLVAFAVVPLSWWPDDEGAE